MRNADKVQFLNFPRVLDRSFLATFFGKTFAQKFSAAQKQTEAIKHILPQWQLPPPDYRPQCLSLLVTGGGPLHFLPLLRLAAASIQAAP